MSKEERLQLENELLFTCSKAQAINKYIDELEESSKLSELWCKSQETVKNLENKLNTQRKYYQNRLMKIQQENKQLKEKQELHLNRIDELTERVVNLKSVIDEVNEEIFNYLISEDYCSAEYKDLPDFLLKINRIIGSVVVKGGNNE